MWSPELRFNWKKNPRISGREQVKATCLGVSCTYVCRACRHPRVCNGVHLTDRSARSDFVGVSSSQVAPWLRGLFLFRFTRIVRHCHFRQTPRLRRKLFLGQGSRQEAESRRRSGGGRGDRRPASGHWASLSPALGGHATLDNLRVLSGRCVLILASWTRCPFAAPSRGLTEFVRGNGRPRRG